MLCNTADWVADAKLMKAAFHELDPGFAPPRPVSANQNGWIGINTPLDVQGFDYSTQVRKGREREELSGSKRGEGVAVPHLVVPRLTSPPLTQNYDGWHTGAPNIPSISSETSSAVSDRGEYVNNQTAGHVQAYDNQYPGWGESAEQAWGGVGEKNGQGILTRPFISGGWTWTGEPRDNW